MNNPKVNQGVAIGAGVIVVLGLLMFGTSVVQSPGDVDSVTNTSDFDQVPQANIEQTAIQTTPEATKPEEIKKETTKIMSEEITTKEGLKYTDIVVGTGAVAVAGKEVTVHYTGTFTNGKKFDSSVDRGQPLPFLLGAGKVIKGWDLGVAGMKVGGKRQLTIPASLGYGANTYGPIPGNSTLLFDVELLSVK